MPLLRFSRHPIATVALSLLVVSCAVNPDGSLKTNEDGTYQMDEKAKGALLGAAAGCALASVTGKECAKGAVVGAVAGFLISWYFESQKVATAAVVNKEYANGKIKPPKNDIIPAAFTSKVVESPASADGQSDVKITSTTDLIGYGDKVPEVQQKFAVYDETNKLIEEKTEKMNAVDGAGRYQTTSKFQRPADAKGKKYTVKTSLQVNGQTKKENSYKIAFADEAPVNMFAQDTSPIDRRDNRTL